MKRRIILVSVHLLFLFLAIFIAFCDFNNVDYYKYIYNIGNVTEIFHLNLFQLVAIGDLCMGLIELIFVVLCIVAAVIKKFVKKQSIDFYLKDIMFYIGMVFIVLVTFRIFLVHGTFVA